MQEEVEEHARDKNSITRLLMDSLTRQSGGEAIYLFYVMGHAGANTRAGICTTPLIRPSQLKAYTGWN